MRGTSPHRLWIHHHSKHSTNSFLFLPPSLSFFPHPPSHHCTVLQIPCHSLIPQQISLLCCTVIIIYFHAKSMPCLCLQAVMTTVNCSRSVISDRQSQENYWHVLLIIAVSSWSALDLSDMMQCSVQDMPIRSFGQLAPAPPVCHNDIRCYKELQLLPTRLQELKEWQQSLVLTD